MLRLNGISRVDLFPLYKKSLHQVLFYFNNNTKNLPLDTFKIWKIGKSIRLDYSVVGFKKLRKKLRDMSLIFNPTNKSFHKK